MINKVLIVLLVMMSIVIAGLSTTIHIQKVEKASLKEQLESIEQQNLTIKHFIDRQNESITEANKKIVAYQAEIETIQKEADKRVKQLAIEVKKIATCEDGWKVLQKELQHIKEATK